MDLSALKIFLAVAHERSFSRAAAKVHRTQPAVSQAVRRLEVELGEQLFDRSSKTGTLTEAGRMLQNYGQRLVRLAEETESAVRELRDLRRGRVLIGANEAAVHTLLPLIVPLPPALSRHRHRRAPRAGAPDRRRSAAGQPRLRRADVSSVGGGAARSAGRQRRARPAGAAVARPRRSPAGGDGRHRAGTGGGAQRSVAGARARAAAVRGASRAAEAW